MAAVNQISFIIKYDSKKSSYQLHEAEFYQVFTAVENGQINKICREKGLEGTNFSEYFFENIKRFIRAYLKKRSKEEFEKNIDPLKNLQISLLVEYFLIRFFETEIKIRKGWEKFPYPSVRFLNKQNQVKLDSVFHKEIKKRENLMADYFHLALEDKQGLVSSYGILYERLRNRIYKQLLSFKDIDRSEIARNIFHELLIGIAESIKSFTYYYEASPDNYLINTVVFLGKRDGVIRESYPDYNEPLDLYEEIEDTIQDEEPYNIQVLEDIWRWVKNNLDEQQVYLFELYDNYLEQKNLKKKKIKLPYKRIQSWEDITREFNDKFPDVENEIETYALKMRLSKIKRQIRESICS